LQSKIRDPKSKIKSALLLLVFRVAADDPHNTLAADDLAVFADPPDARTHFHDRSAFPIRPKTGEPSLIAQNPPTLKGREVLSAES
jgi:hypothetical protein